MLSAEGSSLFQVKLSKHQSIDEVHQTCKINELKSDEANESDDTGSNNFKASIECKTLHVIRE